VRPRLRERLDTGAESALTLVSASAGFGKTSVLAEWIATPPTGERRGAWLSLDDRDNDPTRFWTYVIAALRTAVDGIGGEALSLQQPPQAPTEAVLSTLLNELGRVDSDVVLVLDDFHLIENSEICDGLAFLLEHRPSQLHLVIATRADPDLPLARLRARGQLVEIRATDLRFTREECAAYLNDMMGLELTGSDIAALEDRTEGWIAALQLAALSMQGRDDRPAFIAGFAGHDRYIVDYLVQEVLHQQSQDVRDFLLHTCILDRLNAPLCDAVTGRHEAKAMLIALEHDNLFVVPLDDHRQSYRYHHLFADVLHAHLLDEQPDVVAELHRRASEWYDRNGDPLDAVRHALTGEDLGRAADLMEQAIPGLRRSRREAVMRSWLDVLPEGLLRSRPVLHMGLVGALAASGEFTDIEGRLQDIERCLADAPINAGEAPQTSELVVHDREEFARLPAEIEMYRAAQALVSEDVLSTVEHAQRAVDLSPDGDHLPRAGGTALLGLASWRSGDLQAADRAYADAMGMFERTGHDADVLGCATALADLRIAQGRLGDAMRSCERALAQVGGREEAVRGTADLHVSLSEVYLERNDLQAVREHLLESKTLDEYASLPRNRHRCRIAMARLREAEGRLDEAIDYLDRAERVYTADFFPDVQPIPALRARVHLKQGRLADALGWARQQGLTPDDDLDYLSETNHITLARVLLAEGGAGHPDVAPIDEAIRLLSRLLRAADESGRTGSSLEILVLLAVAHQRRVDKAAAGECLGRALTIAEAEGHVRVFIEQGPTLAALLRAHAKQQASGGFAQQLLAAMNGTGHVGRAPTPLIDPLSARELEVLRLLATDLDGPDIARELVVSLNTVRTHTKRIYTKLGVNNRRAAVRRAQELALLTRTA
jgi:LuxR family transcriptional regulator, maltose regulon positive regulatory protein